MSKQTILVVDDERDLLDLIEYNLKKEGFKVLKAENGEEGISKAKEHKPDLILLDIMMPKMDGLEAVEIMRKDDDLKQQVLQSVEHQLHQEKENYAKR